ncbi:MAG: hypothetical protein SNJ84_04525 [Verrucomicrobiia bacterium]
MHEEDREALDRLWEEYRLFFDGFDDPTLARFMAQLLGQMNGGIWRGSHPMSGLLRLAAQTCHQRGLRIARHARVPEGYEAAVCCGAPMVPLFTRDVLERGFICPFCDGTVRGVDDLPDDAQQRVRSWAEQYGELHEVAHWDERQRAASGDYEEVFNRAAQRGTEMWIELVEQVLPMLVPEVFPTMIWEDHDECLDIRPEDMA